MTTHHGGTGHTGKDGDLDSYVDITTKGDTGCIDITLQKSDAPLHGHTMYPTEANKANKFTATGHCHPQ